MPSAVPSRLTSSCCAHRVGVEVDEQAGDLDAGVVDQDVEAAELVGRVGDRGLPAGVVGDVEVDEAVPLAERLGHLGPEVVLQVGDDDVGAGRGQRLGHPLAEPLGPAGDQGLAAGQVEIRHTGSFVEAAWSRHRRQPPRLGLTSVKTLLDIVKTLLDTCQETAGMPRKLTRMSTATARRAQRPADSFDARRDQLAESALLTLGELGYARTSLREIADNSAFSHGVVHYYFDDKLELIVYCVRYYKARCVHRYDAVVADSTSGPGLLDAFAAQAPRDARRTRRRCTGSGTTCAPRACSRSRCARPSR